MNDANCSRLVRYTTFIKLGYCHFQNKPLGSKQASTAKAVLAEIGHSSYQSRPLNQEQLAMPGIKISSGGRTPVSAAAAMRLGNWTGPGAFTVPPVRRVVLFCTLAVPKQATQGTRRKPLAFSSRALEEAMMPVFIMWAVPAVIVIGGASYYLLRAVH
jgi:hypothetical protein